LAFAILHRLRTIEPARGEMLHQSQKERQIVGRDPLLVKREDEIAAIGMQQEVRVLDALGNTLVGQQLAEPVAGEKASQALRSDVGVNGHAATPPAERRATAAAAGKTRPRWRPKQSPS